MKILLITYEGSTPHQLKEEHIKKIQSIDPSTELYTFSAIDTQEIEHHIRDADIIAGFPRTIPSLENAKNLKWVHSFSAGMDRVLTPEFINSPVLASNSSGIHATPLGEHVLGFMLLFTRKFYQTFQNQQRKIWQRDEGITELRGKTVLIAGLGHIGKEVARLSRCFGIRVFAIDTPGKEKPEFVEELGSEADFSSFLPKADFVVLCLPHTKETHHFFGKDHFSRMKPTAVLINIGRGGLVDEKELIDALQKKIIGGAAVDVTETEPLPRESPLWEMENVIITPHHSGLSEKYMDRATEQFCVNLEAFLKGEPLPNLVDKTAGY